MPHSCDLGSLDRRDFLVLIAAGVVAAVSGCKKAPTGPVASADPLVPRIGGPASTTSTTVPPPLPPIPRAQPGRAVVVSHAPYDTQQIAFTIDDGYCDECVAGYVDFVERTGFNLTLSPNGAFHDIWDTYADRLQPLIRRGQVQIGNHTWSHPNLLMLSDSAIRREIERNEDWIQATFGVTARPWFRPPYGKRNSHTDGVAAGLGYTKILMWNASLGDAVLETSDGLLGQAEKWIKAGAIVLGHANHPTVIHVFDELQAIIADRGLEPVTLDMMFGTTRAYG
jgi:peptidoglycan/xylan/chitin deacetylase (PgdA/CDA1 family)